MKLFLFLSFDSTGVPASKLIIIGFLWSQVRHMAIKKGQIIYRKERVSASWVSKRLYIFIFMCGRVVEGRFSVFSFGFYNVVELWSSLLTYPKATGQTVWQGSIICHHCTYGHSLRSLLKGALQSFTAVARLVWVLQVLPLVWSPQEVKTPHADPPWGHPTFRCSCEQPTCCSSFRSFSQVIHKALLLLQSLQPQCLLITHRWRS